MNTLAKRDFLFVNCQDGRHRWRSVGGKACCCSENFDGCSIPVNECEVCGDCDYGDNDEAREIKAECAILYPEVHTP